jgi:hypothetical protein
MTSRVRALTAGAATATVAALAIALLALGGPDPAPAANPRDEGGAVRTGCKQQSTTGGGNGQQTSGFPALFTSPRNLVVGPLVLVGGATFTNAATARRFGGQKYPLVVRAGHTVTVSVPASARAIASLGYGPHKEDEAGVRAGHHTVTFAACPPGKAGRTTARAPVRFWSGFILVSEPACVPLDVYAGEAATPRRVKVEVGKRCTKPPPLRGCGTHVEDGRGPSDAGPRPQQVVIGPLRFGGLARVASRRDFALSRTRDVYAVKAGVGVPAGVRATLSIGRSARSWAKLDYAPAVPGEPRVPGAAVRFEACAAEHPAFSYDGPVGPITGFSGGFVLKRGGCVPLEVRVAGRPVVRARVPFGIGTCKS